MTDPKVEEIRARLATRTTKYGHISAEFIANAPTDIALLLTKLDEAETVAKVNHGLYKSAESDLNGAEERERTLIAGVREAQEAAVFLSDIAENWGYGATVGHIEEILSRLLPSDR